MVRTQIYLEQNQLKALNRLKRETGKSQSELIREAIDGLAQRHAPGDRLSLLRAGRGLWKGRDDLPDFKALRSEMDNRLHSDG
ncbi:MAG TPA: ribbon-helix-helix protein, CopG family [Rhodothermales bacterium]|nr:ribbon-helix-helix protein, CopG family [Rhodothermales bacterium]